MSFPSRPEYEKLVYGLVDNHPEVVRSSLQLYSTSALTAILEGTVRLRNKIEIRIVEALDFKNACIQRYSYTVYHGGQKVRWYDSQPHPEETDLASTFPHHYHEEPDIKHNRKPAPGISFTSSNLSNLITDCIALR